MASHPLAREGVQTLEPNAGSVLTQGAPVDMIRPLGPPTLGDLVLNAPPPGDATIIPGDRLTPFIDHSQVGFNSHYTDIPDSDVRDEDRRPSLSRTAEDIPSNTDSDSSDDGRFLTDPDEVHTSQARDSVIDSFDSVRITSSSQDFFLVTDRKYRNTQRRMRHRSSTPPP